MQLVVRRVCLGLVVIALAVGSGSAQEALTWQEVHDKFEASNPTLRAGQIGIDESHAQEITANLRPNPNLTILADQIDPFSGGPAHGPFAYFLAAGTAAQTWVTAGECTKRNRRGHLRASRPGANSVV